jgi:DNA-binding transcriptional regulator YiaG
MSETTYGTDATAADTASIKAPKTAAPTFASLAHRTALLRDRVHMTQSDVVELHQTAQLGDLDERTSRVAFQESTELLEALAGEYGLSWTGIARLVGVSDAAVRKWRRGEPTTPENRRRLARGVACLQIIEERFPVRDAASWLEMRISDDATITPVDLFNEGRVDLLFELVGARANPHQVLDAFDSNWRQTYCVDEQFRVVDAPDGEPVITQRRDV